MSKGDLVAAPKSSRRPRLERRRLSPEGHAKHALPSSETQPGSQVTHWLLAVAPRPAVAESVLRTARVPTPLEVVLLPGSQLLHSTFSSPPPYLPFAHFVHSPWPAAEYVPGSQSLQ